MDIILNDTLALYENPATVKHREDLGGAAFVAHGWYSATRDLARAAALLDDAGLDHVTSPLRRSMAEHALALHWLLDKPEAVLDSLRHAQQESVKKLREAMAPGSWTIPEDVFEDLLNPVVSGSAEDVNLHFTNLARQLGQLDLLAAWLHEAATCHPSLASASRYTATWPDDKAADVRSAGDSAHSGKAQAALLLLLASGGFNQFLVDAPWTARLADLETRFVDQVRRSTGKR